MRLELFGAVTVESVTPVTDDGDALLGAARAFATASLAIADATTAAGNSWSYLPEAITADRLTEALAPVMRPAVHLADGLEASARALRSIATDADRELARLKRNHEQLTRDIEHFRASAPGHAEAHVQQLLTSGHILSGAVAAISSWDQVPTLVSAELALRLRVAAHNRDVETTTRRLAARIDRLEDGSRGSMTLPDLGSVSPVDWVAYGGVPPAAAAAFMGMTPLALLDELTPDQLEAAFLDNPSMSAWLAGLKPRDAYLWWSGLSADQRTAVLAVVPELIGKTEGIPYSDRSTANVMVLRRELQRLRERGETGGEEYAALTAVEDALNKKKGQGVPYQLISITLGEEPLAAISVGDLDTAQNATWLVPGMNTTVTGDITKDVAAARNFKDQQDLLVEGDGAHSAVVAWIGYHPPMTSRPVDEARHDKASVGGKLLAADISGFHNYRAAAGGEAPVISIVGHSYGTLVAAVALTTAHVDHAIFEGSPGIPTAIADSSADLNLPPGELYVTQSSDDGWAPFGQHHALEDRVDPSAQSFHAHDFSSDGDDGHLPVDNHGPIDDPGSGRSSYWNKFTSSIFEAAKATLGRGSEVPVGGTPADRWLEHGGHAGPYIDNGSGEP